MIESIKKHKIQFVVITCIIFILLFFYVVLYLLNLDIIRKYEKNVFPGMMVNQFDVSNMSFEETKKFLLENKDAILATKIILLVDGNEYEYSLKDLGVEIDLEGTINQISGYQKHLPFSKKILYINNHKKNMSFSVLFQLDEVSFPVNFQAIKDGVERNPIDGYFDTSEGVKYVAGIDGFRLDDEKNYNILKNYFKSNYDYNNIRIQLVGNNVSAYTNEAYLEIDTMTSSFYTEYETWLTQRSENLRAGVRYINGAIVQPGEVFSFFSYAGPYDKEGYVFYYVFYGNGVCQVATTVYNAALLGGHEIVKRTAHAQKSVYVPGGLDATVASSSDGSWNTDMQFRNTYDYPIYIKAYDTYGEIHVEFWSSSKALNGKSYSTESVWLGGRGYQTFLHTYQDGVEISRDFIATTWYTKD